MVYLFDIVKIPCDDGEHIEMTMYITQKNSEKRSSWAEM